MWYAGLCVIASAYRSRGAGRIEDGGHVVATLRIAALDHQIASQRVIGDAFTLLPNAIRSGWLSDGPAPGVGAGWGLAHLRIAKASAGHFVSEPNVG